MTLDLNLEIKTRPKRIKHYASQIELDDDWREIKGFPHYRINRHGQVKRLDAVIVDSRGIPYRRKGRILNNRKTPGGYVQVDMSEDGVIHGRFVHVLLAKAFIPNPNNLPIVNHKDENPSNYDLSNLEWCDYSYNAKYSIDSEEGMVSKEINIGLLQLGIHVPTDDYSVCGKGDYIINIDEFNINNDDINYVCNNALTLCK